MTSANAARLLVFAAMPELTIQQAYEMAVQLHRTGQLQQADAMYRKILAAEPDHADALQMLGAIAFAIGRHTEAIPLIRRAITLNPQAAEYHSNLPIVLATAGQADAAIDALRQAIALKPDYADAHYNL